MKSFIFGFLISCFSLTICYNQDDFLSKNPFQAFMQADKNNLENYDVMSSIFASTDLSVDKLLSAIRVDLIRCRRYMRVNDKKSEEQLQVVPELRSFLQYIKTHKHCYNAMQLHAEVQQRYALAFDNPRIVQCIHTTPELYGISKKLKQKCKAYFNQVVKDLAKIDKFEDYLHADHSELKARNYVLKIELIKLRNSIYHDNIYKYETSYF